MLLNFKILNKINYCYNNEIKFKLLKSFISKNMLSFSLRLVTMTYFYKFIYFLYQINNFCNSNNKFRSVFRSFRFNRFSLFIFIKIGLIKGISKCC